jgi:hypothetical protein
VKPQPEVDFFDAFAAEHGDYDVLGEGAYRRLLSRFEFLRTGHSPLMWLYRSPHSPLHSKAGKMENEVFLMRSQLRTELRQAGLDGISVQGVGGITYRYVECRVARTFLPLYNLYESLLRISPLENWLGTFLISFDTKPTRR